jgi:hypothetical protein
MPQTISNDFSKKTDSQNGASSSIAAYIKAKKNWERFMARFLQSVTEYLKSSKGLDMLEGFTPTVLKTLFDGATTAILRTHFGK